MPMSVCDRGSFAPGTQKLAREKEWGSGVRPPSVFSPSLSHCQQIVNAEDSPLVSAGREPEFLARKHGSRILRHSSNPVYGFSMMKQVRLCCLAHGELARHFLEPDTGLNKNPTLVL